jgi:addiction module HigA family antidote
MPIQRLSGSHETMKAPVSKLKDSDLQKAPQALMRAAEKARQLAEQTGTRFVVRESAVTRLSKRKLSNIHPGEVLRDEFLIPYDLSQSRLAREIGVSHARICAICSGKRAITADTALRLAAFFGTSSGFWLGLQADYDTEEAAKELTGVLAQIHRFEPLAA